MNLSSVTNTPWISKRFGQVSCSGSLEKTNWDDNGFVWDFGATWFSVIWLRWKRGPETSAPAMPDAHFGSRSSAVAKKVTVARRQFLGGPKGGVLCRNSVEDGASQCWRFRKIVELMRHDGLKRSTSNGWSFGRLKVTAKCLSVSHSRMIKRIQTLFGWTFPKSRGDQTERLPRPPAETKCDPDISFPRGHLGRA